MPIQQQDSNYKPLGNELYDPKNSVLTVPTSAPLTTATDGTQYAYQAVTLVDGYKATYSSSIAALASAASATDIYNIVGSATKTVRILRLEIQGQATAAAAIAVRLAIRSTANTAGTAQTAIPHDSASAAATAVVQSYTANPATLGTLVGTPGYFRNNWLFVGAPATNTVGDQILVYDFGNASSQAVVLRGVLQSLSVNLAAVTITGGSFDINVVWTEE